MILKRLISFQRFSLVIKQKCYNSYKISHDIPLQDHKPSFLKDKTAKYEISKLKNGIKVFTESTTFPFYTDLGILINVGSRDETVENSGTIETIKSNYLRTLKSQDGIMNLKTIQISGSHFTMDFDQETMYYRANCLNEYMSPILDIMLECALQPKTFIKKEQKIKDDSLILPEENAETLINSKITETSFGLEGLGLPLNGIEENLAKISNESMLKFYMENVSPEKVYICAAGIKDHNAFVQMLEEKSEKIVLSPHYKLRKKSSFKGGYNVIPSERDEVHCALVFESVPWSSEEMAVFNVVNTILGSSNSFSTGGPGKGMHSRTTKNLLNSISYVQSASGINYHYSDSGIFGLKVSGDHNNRKELVNLVINELKKLCKPFPIDEVRRGKNILKSKIYLSLERQSDRLEEAVKNINSFQKLIFPHYKELIDSITEEKIHQTIKRVIQSTPGVVLMGKDLDDIPNIDEIIRRLRI